MADKDDVIGQLVEPADARRRWRELVFALHEAAAPGGPLEDWAFHGTTSDAARWIERDGVAATHAVVDEDGCSYRTEATHWATPKVAAFYAEDRIESFQDPRVELAIVAASMETLEEHGRFAADANSVDGPIVSRMALTEHEAYDRWEHSPKGWRDCLAAFESFLVLGPVGPEAVRVIRGLDDLNALIAETALAPALA